eukprot:TRINITY_DN152_c0_g1_i6.p1 TRINITY_DN152_c0_g1~~TRINITY_DN152_c0_g1_i6.p1  ORF type:complete len:527 (-),score=147.29 TRINITY_DN152_c0_g1_i6:92-1618(-)
MKVFSLVFLSTVTAFETYSSDEDYTDTLGADQNYRYGLEHHNYGYGQGYGPHGGGDFGGRGFGGGKGGFRGMGYGGYNGMGGQYGMYKGGGGNPLVAEAMYKGPNQFVGGGRFALGYGGIKNPLAPIVNSAYQSNFSPMKKFGFGGFEGHNNYAGGEINDYLWKKGERPLDPDDLDDDNEADFLTATKHKIDNYIAKQWLMGRRKLTVSVNYANMPLEYLYLSQYHGFPNPVAGTPLGKRFGLTTKPNDYNNPKSPGAYTQKNYMKKLKPTPPPKKFSSYAHDKKDDVYKAKPYMSEQYGPDKGQHHPGGPQHIPKGEPQYQPRGGPQQYKPQGDEPQYQPQGQPQFPPQGGSQYQPPGQPPYQPQGGQGSQYPPQYQPQGGPQQMGRPQAGQPFQGPQHQSSAIPNMAGRPQFPGQQPPHQPFPGQGGQFGPQGGQFGGQQGPMTGRTGPPQGMQPMQGGGPQGGMMGGPPPPGAGVPPPQVDTSNLGPPPNEHKDSVVTKKKRRRR